MNRLPLLLVVAACLLTPASVLAQEGKAAPRPITASLQGVYGITTTNLLATARQLDESMYAFGPTEEVRTAGQILAHVANAQYLFCSTAAGEQSPNSVNIEKDVTSKEGIVAALSGAFDYCNGVFTSMTDESGTAMRTLFGNDMAAAAVLAFNTAHNYEHYGNLVTYMRINGIVPPSSQ